MKEKVRMKNEGITLIALVITIIILLILASVTIAALSGDNGILSNAAKAKTETEKSAIIEEIRLGIYAEMADNEGKDPTQSDIEKIASEYGTIEGEGDNRVLVTFEGNYKIKISDIWNVIQDGGMETAANEITSEDYGKYVNYNVDYDNDGTVSDDWRIFYNDGNNVYLISSDYVALEEYESAISGYRSLDLSVLGYNTTDEAIEFLLNQENWKTLKQDNIAQYVVGAPTLEMYADSWNQTNMDDQIVLSEGEEGWLIDGTAVSKSFEEEPSDLYYISKGKMPYDNTNNMWIASKMNNGNLLKAGYALTSYESSTQGNITGNPGRYSGVRPIVCLDTNVKIESGVGTIDEPFEIVNE